MSELKTKNQTGKQRGLEIVRFLIVGGFATLLDYATAYFSYRFLLPPAKTGTEMALFFSTLFGFLIGLLVNWVLSVRFVFRDGNKQVKTTSKKEFLLFTAVALVGLALTEMGMSIVPLLKDVSLFGEKALFGVSWGWWIMKASMTCIVLVWNYVGRKLFVFR